MPAAKNLIDKKFGSLLVIEKTDRRSSNGSVYWKCKCDCGNEVEVITSSLTSGNTKSCGCLNKNTQKRKGGHALDLTGEKFGKLQPLYPIYIDNIRKWHCKCDCGNETDVLTSKLRNGHTVSCGCVRRTPKTKDEDMIGKNFGRLTVLHREKEDNSNWVCRCECGNLKIVSQSNLVTNTTQSCGCLAIEKSKESIKNIAGWNFQDLTNQTFGKLTVLGRDKEKNNKVYWKCKCDCGNITSVRADELKDGKVLSCGCLKSKGEEKISKILKENNIAFIQQYSFPDLLGINQGVLRFDFYVNNKYLIEFDGIQHFQVTNGWNTEKNFEKVKKHDIIKNEYCKKHNIPLIRIPYTHLDELCIEDLLLDTTLFEVEF